MKRKSWLFVALGAVVVGVAVYVIAFGQPLRVVTPQLLAVHDVNDVYYLLDAKLTELSQKLDALSAATVCTKSCRQRWEYQTYGYISYYYSEGDPIKEEFTTVVREWGEEGWELVSGWRESGGSNAFVWRLLFKHPLG